MELFTLVIGKIDKETAKESNSGLMALYMRVIGRTTWLMVEVVLFMQMVMHMYKYKYKYKYNRKGIGWMIEHKVMVFIIMLMELNMKVNG